MYKFKTSLIVVIIIRPIGKRLIQMQARSTNFYFNKLFQCVDICTDVANAVMVKTVSTLAGNKTMVPSCMLHSSPPCISSKFFDKSVSFQNDLVEATKLIILNLNCSCKVFIIF